MRETSTDANEARRQPLHRPAEQRVAASDRPGRARGLCGTRRHTRDARTARTARPGHAGDTGPIAATRAGVRSQPAR
ncbi:transposase [Burkholderia pseudomallei MSHR346]|nr:transposase [Burkholderia pseudomallei MSHR346]